MFQKKNSWMLMLPSYSVELIFHMITIHSSFRSCNLLCFPFDELDLLLRHYRVYDGCGFYPFLNLSRAGTSQDKSSHQTEPVGDRERANDGQHGYNEPKRSFHLPESHNGV